MEEKRREGGTLAPANPVGSPASEPTSSRRRAGAQKRKSSNFGSSNSSSTSSKRITREKASISHPPPLHNGPLTRARQGPSNLASVVGDGAVKMEESAGATVGSVGDTISPADKALEEREALEAKIEAEFEAIKSRDANAHVVPAHCGWFSWTKIHSLEEHSLPSFFNKKSESRNPDMYREIRDLIIKKFHANPKTQIELKDLSELEVGDMEARQEVMDFLNYWGLINFNPVLASDSDREDINGDAVVKDDSLLEKLYSFENPQSCARFVPKTNLLAPAVPSGLFPESATAEELTRPEGPAVEYHCNSCSADCSRKRYHCQKQADFDLCSDCFNNGKFGSGMSSSDFILMEPAEVPGVSGGNWTDQETLLLLEALELYKENWNEIAEHVATKTKAQCMLHFVQMPIEDVFLDCDDDVDGGPKETKISASTNNDSSVVKETPGAAERKDFVSEGQLTTSAMETLKPEGASEGKNSEETPKEDDTSDAKTNREASKEKDTSAAKFEEKSGENLAFEALREAFDDIGYPLTLEGPHSFAEVGNPVMAVAAFLARLVGPDLASASARCSLKSLTEGSGIQLAARHCFCLEDPPVESKELVGSESVAGEMVDQDAQKDVNKKDKVRKEDNSTTSLKGKDLSNDQSKGEVGDLLLKEKEQLNSSNGDAVEKLDTAREPCRVAATEEPQAVNANEVNNLELAKDHTSRTIESNDAASKPKLSEGSVMDSDGKNSVATASQSSYAAKDVDTNRGPLSSKTDKPQQLIMPDSVIQPSQDADASKDVDMVPDSVDPETAKAHQSVTSKSVGEPSPLTLTPKGSAIPNPPHSKVNEPQQQVTSSAVVDNGPSSGERQTKYGQKENLTVEKDDQNVNRIKHAAVSALAAAAVKAKLLADQEEEQIRQLAASLIEKQLCKLETKLAFFNEMESVTARIKEQLERSRQRLYHERAQIIASRFASSSRGMHPSLPNRITSNSVPRPPMGMTLQRPSISRPMGMMGPTASNTLASGMVPSGPVQPSSQENIPSVGTK